MPFDPDVRPWSGVSAVSPSTYLILSTPMPSSSPAIWRMAMRRPWPRSTLPQNSVTVPSPSTARKESSSLGSTIRGAGAAPWARVCKPASAKPTVSAPALSIVRRVRPRAADGAASGAASSALGADISASLSRGRHHGADDPHMRSAPAEITGERSADIVFRRFGFFGKESGGADDHAAGAIAALRHLFFDEGGLYRMRRRDRSESLKRNDRFALRIRNRLKARSRRASVEENAAGAALAEATSEFGRGEPQSAQAEKQRLIW